MATKAQIDILVNTAESANSLKQFRTNINEIQKAINEATDPKDTERLTTALALAKAASEDLGDRLRALGQNNFERLASIGSVVAGGFQVATGALGLFGTENEKLNEIINQTNALFATFAGLGQLAEAPRQLKDIALAFGLVSTAKKIDTIETDINTTSQLTNTSATKGAAAATNLLGNSLKALGIGLIVSAVAALVIYWEDLAKVIGITSDITNTYEKAQSKVTSEVSNFNKNIIDVNNSIKSAREGVISKEEALKTYNDTLGKSVGYAGDLDQAEQLLKTNTSTVVESIKLRTLAQIFYGKSAEAAAKAASGEGVEPTFWQEIGNSILSLGNPTSTLIKNGETIAKNLNKLNEDAKKYSDEGDKLIEKAIKNDEKLTKGLAKSPEEIEKKRKENFEKEINDVDKFINDRQSKYDDLTRRELNEFADEKERLEKKIKIAKKYGEDTSILQTALQDLEQKQRTKTKDLRDAQFQYEKKLVDDTKKLDDEKKAALEKRVSDGESLLDIELKNKKANYKTQKELDDNALLDEIKNVEAKIELRKKEGAETASLLAELATLRQQYSFKQQKDAEDAIANSPDYFNQFFGIKSEDELAKMTPKEKSALMVETIANTFASLQDTINGFYELRLQELEQQKNDELDLFDKQTERELQGVEKGSEREKNILQRRQLEREKLERDADKKARGIQKEQAQFQNTIALFRAIADGAAATIGAFRLDPSGILASFVAATAAAQVALIIAQGNQIAKIKAEKGGLLLGPSHSQGGIKGSGTFGNIEVEGGEFIMNKTSTSRYLPLLESLNRPGNTNLNMDPISSKLDAVERQLILLNNNPTRAYIIDRDLTETQDKIEFIKRRTEF